MLDLKTKLRGQIDQLRRKHSPTKLPCPLFPMCANTLTTPTQR